MRALDGYSLRRLSRSLLAALALLTTCVALAGCNDEVRLPSTMQLVEFHDAGSNGPTVDLGRVTTARLTTGPYLVKPGEVLEITMPTVLQVVTAEAAQPSQETAPYLSRVSEAGTITLPAVGEIPVAGKSTAQIEAAVAGVYFPKFTTTRPSVYVRILEYKTHRVSIVGAVKEPGLYDLRADKMSLVALIMEAQGITEDGAAVIRISRPDAILSTRTSRGNPLPSSHGRITDADPALSSAGTADVRVGSLPDSPATEWPAPLRVRFEWTGPLYTSGSVVLERDGAVIGRKWLDIGVPLQRRQCLTEFGDRIAPSDVADLVTAFASLAQWLERNPRPSGGIPETPPPDWDTTDGVHFTMDLDKPSEKTHPGPQYVERKSPAMAPAMLSGAPVSLQENPRVLLLPVRGLNIPFTDVALQEGDAVVVEPLVVSFVSVLGLVSRPGNFEYPPGVAYNLGQVIALAGGLDKVADPRYATIYRLNPDGSIVHAVFQIHGGRHKSELTDAFSVPVKPGDIVAVEQTPRTRSNQFIDRVFRINIGTYTSMDRLWD